MKIEKNIPIGPRQHPSKYGLLVAKMKTGDSVLCKDTKETNLVRASISNLCKGYKPISRKQKGKTTRVWKVKEDE